MKNLMLAALASAALSLPAFGASGAQSPQATSPNGEISEAPSISGGATSEVKVSPDRATVRISVQTQAATAAAAGTANAARQTAVLSALRAIGIANEQLTTTGYNVNPEYRYEQNKNPTVTGYTVTNTIVAEIRSLPLVGKALDAALAAGANQISSLEFYASRTDSARQRAIELAITKARSEAEVAAVAAGGKLGSLISLEIDSPVPSPIVRPIQMMAKSLAAPVPTPINPGDESVTSTVSARWHFIPR